MAELHKTWRNWPFPQPMRAKDANVFRLGILSSNDVSL
jgi:hypothetical protein